VIFSAARVADRTNATNVTPRATLNPHAQQVIGSVMEELNQLFRERAELMKRIGTVRQTLACLARMYGEDQLAPEALRLVGRGAPARERGLTRACRLILLEAATPVEVRQGLDELRKRFPQLVEHHKDPLASITTIFNRLVRSGEARTLTGSTGRRAWEWIADPENSMLTTMSNEPAQEEPVTKQ